MNLEETLGCAENIGLDGLLQTYGPDEIDKEFLYALSTVLVAGIKSLFPDTFKSIGMSVMEDVKAAFQASTDLGDEFIVCDFGDEGVHVWDRAMERIVVVHSVGSTEAYVGIRNGFKLKLAAEISIPSFDDSAAAAAYIKENWDSITDHTLPVENEQVDF